MLILAFSLLVGGPVIFAVTGVLEPGALIFCAGVVLVGFYSLVSSQDKAVSWVLIFVGTLAAAAEIMRLLLFA